MKEIQILNNGDALYDIRRKINENFELMGQEVENGDNPLTKFGVNEGNETNGVADLIEITEDTLNFKVGGQYPNLVITSGDGVTTRIENVNPLYLQNLADGEYTVLVDGSNSNITDATFYSQLLEPENVNNGDVWFNGENAVQSKYEMTVNPTTAKTGADFTCMASMGQYRLAAGNTTVVVFSSDSGATWTNVSLSSASTIYMVGCVVHDGAFRLVSRDRYIYSVNTEGRISGGTQVTSDTSIQLTNLKHINNHYVVTCSNGSIFYSTNFQNWTTGVTGSQAQLLDIAFCNGNYYTINSNGEMFISSDLQSWTKQTTNITYTTCLQSYDNKLLIGSTTGALHVYDTVTSNMTVIDSIKTAQILDISVVNNNVLIVGRDGLCAVTNDLKTLRLLTVTEDNKNLTCIHENYILGQGGLMLQWTFYNEWIPYPYIPVGEVIIEGGEVTYFTTYPYNTNGLFDATSSTFGLLRTAAEPDELNCHCQDAVLTPANLYSLNNYRTMNTSYEVDDKVGCPYHHNLQLKCTQTGTTSNEALNTKGYLESGTIIEDGTVIWEVQELGTGGGLEIGDIGFTQMAIDESKGKRRILNGQLIIQDQYQELTKIIKNSVALNPELACTESEWQTAITMSTNGVCYKFVIDDNAGTIRLPKYPNYFIAGLKGTAPVVGNGKAIGFTDGSSTRYTFTNGPKGNNLWSHQPSFLNTSNGNVGSTVSSGNGTENHLTAGVYFGLSTDPSKSGIKAQLNNDQTEQIKGNYFIQVATGAETEDNIINEIELNNPFSLLDYKYSEYELNNLSWLRSNGQWNSKAVYPAVYELLLKIYNGTETKAGVSAKLSTGSYTDYDFVLNTAEETFRFPVSVINSAQGYLYFYVGETVQNANLINAGRIEETLVKKVDMQQATIASLPSNRYIDLTLGATGTQYTAPANGYYTWQQNTGAVNQYFGMQNYSCGYIQTFQWAPIHGGGCHGFLPAKKGDVCAIHYTTTGEKPLFRFVYAEGEQ